jgi:hypoxanthine phosphoribosyltransferase
MLSEKVCKPLLTSNDIEGAVERLASEISRDYSGKNPVVLGVLKGSFIFLADIIRKLNFPMEIDFVRMSSYGTGTVTSGRAKMLLRPSCKVEGRDILIIEDIVDTGLTISQVVKYLKRKHPASIRICALADKPERRRVNVTVDYLGFTVPDRFLVGYGLDWDEKYRNLSDICTLDDGHPG